MERLDQTTLPPYPENASNDFNRANANENLISELGWTREEAARIRASHQALKADWNAPGMEAYDEL
jgi:hypothetical protein